MNKERAGTCAHHGPAPQMNFYGPIQDASVIASIHKETDNTTSFYFAGAHSQVVTVANANTGADSIEASKF